jgi:general secretion pathway protein G
MVTAMRTKNGFTLIELLVVMALIAALLSLSVPRYIGNVRKAEEAVLQENLATLRNVLEKYYSDRGKYPATLDELVAARYLKRVPLDPVTDSRASWIVVPPADPEQGGVFDVRSGAPGSARDGSVYRDW